LSSTITGWPRRSFKRSPTARASVSSELPAGAATMKRIGLSGHASAWASDANALSRIAATSKRRGIRCRRANRVYIGA
jgi:hypothetical protein